MFFFPVWWDICLLIPWRVQFFGAASSWKKNGNPQPAGSPARFDLVPPFELPFGPTLPLDLPPLDPEEGEDVIVDASNMNFLHVPAEVDG